MLFLEVVDLGLEGNLLAEVVALTCARSLDHGDVAQTKLDVCVVEMRHGVRDCFS